MEQSKENKLIYVGDPLCSWCYGFSPELQKVVQYFDDKLGLQMVMGGLRPYNTETMEKLGDFLRHHWTQVNQASGQPFNYEILDDSSFVYDTEPPARAVKALHALNPNLSFKFYHDIQTAFYAKGENTNHIQTYVNIIEQEGYAVSKASFVETFESPQMKEVTKADFDYASSLGIRGFPSMVMQYDEKLHLISRGYEKAKGIIDKINAIITPENINDEIR